MGYEVTGANIDAIRREKKGNNMDYKSIIEDVLKDALLGGALASEIFVKNVAHQDAAARMLKAANTLIQVITAQMNSEQQNTPSASSSSLSTPPVNPTQVGQ